MGDLLPIIILVGVAGLVCVAMVTLSWLLGPKKVTPFKSSPYECGVAPTGNARERFPIKFYLVAMLFILFDIEVVFLWSWLTVFRYPNMGSTEADLAFQWFSFGAVMVYMALWILGDAYVLRVNAIQWDDAPVIEEAKFGEVIDEPIERQPVAALQPVRSVQ